MSQPLRRRLLPLVLAAICVVLPTASASAAYVGSWFWQNPIPQGDTISRGDFAGDTGWAVGDGVVLRTVSGGGQWAKQYGVPGADSAHFNDVDAVDNSTAWLAGSNGLLRTVDGGETWEGKAPEGAATPSAIEFVTASEGWFGDSAGQLWRTTDGGDAWKLVTTQAGSFTRIDRYGSAVFATSGGVILRSEVGTEAVSQVASLNDYVTDLSFGDAYHGWPSRTWAWLRGPLTAERRGHR